MENYMAFISIPFWLDSIDSMWKNSRILTSNVIMPLPLF